MGCADDLTIPFRFRNAEVLTAYWRTDPDAIALPLPAPLKAVDDLACVHIYKMNDPDWLELYTEVNVRFVASLGELPGAHSPYLVLSSDFGMPHGREVHAESKKPGLPSLETRGDLIVDRVERNGIDVIDATLPNKQKVKGNLKPYFNLAINLNLKALNHIDGTPVIRQLTSRKLADVMVREAWKGPCTVEFRANAQLPVFRPPVVEPLVGFYWQADSTLVPGEIIHDYREGVA